MPIRLRLPLLALAALAAGCSKDDPPAPQPVAVRISPAEATVAAGGARDFTAEVTGTAVTDVLWNADGGTVSNTGHYVAPMSSGTFHVTVTAQADAAASDTATVTVLPPGTPVTPGDPGGTVRITVDTTQSHPISRFVYGLNVIRDQAVWWGSSVPAGITMTRFGGNRLSAWDWETGYSSCGNDCASYPNDSYLSSVPASPGGVLKARADATLGGGGALLATVPVLGYVARDAAGAVPIPVAPSPTTPATPDLARFKLSVPANPGGASATPNASDLYTYQDDLVKWLDTTYPGAKSSATSPIFYSLDNEPDLWGSTHAEIRGRTASGGTVDTGFEELPRMSIPFALAVKNVVPNAKVLGPAISGWFGFMALGHGDSRVPQGYAWYIDQYLDLMKAGETAHGKRLLDVLDVHWYPEATNVCVAGEAGCYSDRITNDWTTQWPSVIEARVQAPRSLWDPTYVEHSWVTVATPAPGCGSANCPVKLLPRLKASIDARYPGTAIAVTEYYFGRGGDISGGIAQADVLGIFGRDGVFAASLWPTADVYAFNQPSGSCGPDMGSCATLAYQCIFAAFRAYLDYDGAGGRFGDLSASATTSDVAATSAYASIHSSGPDRVVVVAINKTTSPISTGIAVKHASALTKAQVYRITATGSVAQRGCTGPVRLADVTLPLTNAFLTSLPAMSVSVFVLTP